MIQVEIDSHSGFCFGVTTAIKKAEEELARSGRLYCLGDIVHNGRECERLKKLGLITINHQEFCDLHNVKVLLRAHGEPPGTYETARRNNIEIIDATCPVVLILQKRIKQKEEENCSDHGRQTVIYGQKNHAEVLGLVGQVQGKAIVIEKEEDLAKLDYTKDICLFSQTTQSHDDYLRIVKAVEEKLSPPARLYYSDSVCKQVSSRSSNIREFAAAHRLIFFVSGKKSSNGRILFSECKKANPDSYLIENATEIDFRLLKGVTSVGICGATSTPKWLMEDCRKAILSALHTESSV